MRVSVLGSLLTGIILCSSNPAIAQQPLISIPSPSIPTFLGEVALKYPAVVALSTVTLNGNAKWTLGNLKESGTAILVAQADGSTNLQLNLDTATRTESRTALGNSRACQWTDSKGSHPLNDVDCNASLVWFAPMLLVQPLPTLLQLLVINDDGNVARTSGNFRQISYSTPMQGTSTAITNLLTGGTHMSVLYDPQTLLPSSVEYLQHADSDLSITFPVRVAYSNYQTISGVPIPFQIDRYVNNTLQLSLTLNSASTK